MNSQNGVLYTVGDSVRNDRSVRYIQDSGGNSNGVPPLPIPNREVKPIHADGTAFSCGRVGSRLFKRRFTVGAFLCFALWGRIAASGGGGPPCPPAFPRERKSPETVLCRLRIPCPIRKLRIGLLFLMGVFRQKRCLLIPDSGCRFVPTDVDGLPCPPAFPRERESPKTVLCRLRIPCPIRKLRIGLLFLMGVFRQKRCLLIPDSGCRFVPTDVVRVYGTVSGVLPAWPSHAAASSSCPKTL